MVAQQSDFDSCDHAGAGSDLLSLKICMSHQVQRGHLRAIGKYMRQQAARSIGIRCCKQ